MGINSQIADHSYVSQLFRQRAIIAGSLCLLLILALLFRLAYLQIVEFAHFSSLSENNRIRIMALAPTRGLIFDRNGVVLAENQPTFHLEITPEQIENMDETLKGLSEVININEQDLKQFYASLRSNRPFESVALRTRLDDEEVSKFSVNRHRFPGVDISARLSRYYPQGKSAVHAIGYVGRINTKELETIDQSNYSASTHIGKTGIEKYYEKVLHGKVGHQKVEVNSEGRLLNVVEKNAAIPGMNLVTGLDIELQKIAEKAFGNLTGSVIAIEPKTGEILVFVSKPMYDPNLFVHGISHENYKRLQSSVEKPLFNRAIYGQYPPGSTYKPFIGLAGLEDSVISNNEKIKCEGYYLLPDDDERRYRDWKKEGHGHVDMGKAIEESCDVYFYELSYRLGIDRIHRFLAKFGFGEKTNIDLYGERKGLLPSRKWKRRVHKTIWYPGETVIAGIGQGYMLATPLQLASATATLASKGKKIQPRLVKEILTVDGVSMPFEPPKISSFKLKHQENWGSMHEDMARVLQGTWGTARLTGYGLSYKMAGKTGTAQVFGIGQDEEYDAETVAKKLRDHALFIGFAPFDSPELAVAVIAENGEHGSKVAPVVKTIIDRYLKKKNE